MSEDWEADLCRNINVQERLVKLGDLPKHCCCNTEIEACLVRMEVRLKNLWSTLNK